MALLSISILKYLYISMFHINKMFQSKRYYDSLRLLIDLFNDTEIKKLVSYFIIINSLLFIMCCM